MELNEGGHVLIVAHGDTVAQYVALIRHIPEENVYSVPNCAVASAHMTVTSGGGAVYSRTLVGDDVLTLESMVE